MERRRRVYGRRRVHRLRAGRRAVLEALLPTVELTPADLGALGPPGALFTEPVREVWLEIGFGAGEHLAYQLRANADVGIIGCEPFVEGVSRCLQSLDADGTVGRARILVDDARLLVAGLPACSIARAFVLFPDPWPKKRHHKRRIIDADMLAAFARILVDGAELRLATDDPGYLRWMLQRLHGHASFCWLAEDAADWRRRPADWPETRYAVKAADAGRPSTYLRYRRRTRPVEVAGESA